MIAEPATDPVAYSRPSTSKHERTQVSVSMDDNQKQSTDHTGVKRVMKLVEDEFTKLKKSRLAPGNPDDCIVKSKDTLSVQTTSVRALDDSSCLAVRHSSNHIAESNETLSEQTTPISRTGDSCVSHLSEPGSTPAATNKSSMWSPLGECSLVSSTTPISPSYTHSAIDTTSRSRESLPGSDDQLSQGTSCTGLSDDIFSSECLRC